MDRAGVLKTIAAAGLPPEVAAYLSVFAASRAPSRLRRALKRDPAAVTGGLGALLRQAASVLDLPPEKALFETGFDTHNMAPERLEAAVAELRAAVFLHREGFTRVRLLPPCASRTADLSAARGVSAYAFEVRRVGEAAGRPPVLAAKCRVKLRQAAVSRKRGGLSHCGVIFVAGGGDFGPFARGAAREAAAAEVYAAAGSPASTHVCLIDGGQTGVWPPW